MQKSSYFENFKGHLSTITRHKMLVTKLCFKCGLYSQGIKHDLSKYMPTEFFAGVRYYQGFRSPIDAEKEDKGYSLAWLHHVSHNKHHFEYWVDKEYATMKFQVLKMPLNYIIESTLDKIAASKIYNPNYTDASPLEFLIHGKEQFFMGEVNRKRYEILLTYLKENGEVKALNYYKTLYKTWKKNKNFDI